MTSRSAGHGWQSDFPTFEGSPAERIRESLAEFVTGASPQQFKAWGASIPLLQREVREVLAREAHSRGYSTILEYELPLESRRTDVIFLVRGAVVVIELKGKRTPTQADVDQAAAYARDLRCYHRHCEHFPVHAVVVPTGSRGHLGLRSGVHVVGPDALDTLVQELQEPWPALPLEPEEFLAEDAYCPLPTLVKAARELFETGDLRRIRRASASTDPAVATIVQIVREAAETRTRRLVLLTGVPGAGKTLVGLRVAHARILDDLAIERGPTRAGAPAVFLSGNGPLVEVLQYELRAAGGGGKAFVRPVREYVKQYTRRPSNVPPEHVLVFDEAQRAWDAEYVRHKHGETHSRSEAEHFVEFAMRIPEWCVLVGLIGSGQEIHTGEEAGLVQWREAVERCSNPGEWIIHGPEGPLREFDGSTLRTVGSTMLNLDREIRFHAAAHLHAFVTSLLECSDAAASRNLAERLEDESYHLRLTRDLSTARDYLRERYEGHPSARYGIAASSRDRDLEGFGIPNGFQDTKRVRFGPWYGDGEESSLSCRQLRDVVTEFGAQGLELDGVLLAWGTDLLWEESRWTNRLARRYRGGPAVRDALKLRINAYRVLLTRGRDGTVVFVPPTPVLDSTAAFLQDCGIRSLDR